VNFVLSNFPFGKPANHGLEIGNQTNGSRRVKQPQITTDSAVEFQLAISIVSKSHG